MKLERRLDKIKQVGKTIGEYSLVIATSPFWIPALGLFSLFAYAEYYRNINSPEYKEMISKWLDEQPKSKDDIELVALFDDTKKPHKKIY